MPLVAVSAHELDVAGRSIDAALPVEWLDQQLSDAGLNARVPGRLSVRLTRSGADVVVRGRVEAKVVTTCARCTEPVEISVDSDVSLLLEPRPERPPAPVTRSAKGSSQRLAPASDKAKQTSKKKPKQKEPEHEFAAEDADIDTYDGETVVLDDFIREAILLEMPIFPLCSEDCPGIRRGASEAAAGEGSPSVDPRLLPLGALRDKLERTALAGAHKASPKGGASLPVAHSTSTKKKTKKE